MYTSSSGIWQPVWLEPVDASGINTIQLIPDVDNARLRLFVNTYLTNGVTVNATILSNSATVSTASGNPRAEIDLPVANANLWSPENPFLYNVQINVVHSGVTNDSVTSYFGMRKISVVSVQGVPQIFLNNQSYFEMGPLDQGFWPDGIYTAPTDAALAYDIQMEKALGFNMVRKHIKVERQRWYYWCDKFGILVWQDMPSCNSYTGSPQPIDASQFIAELTAMVTNHWNSPAIVDWTLFNESQGQDGNGQTNTPYLVNHVQTLDPSRLVNQASGGSYYGVGNILDNHSYPDPGDPMSSTQATVDGEFGGIAWHVNGHLWNPAQAGNGYLLAGSLDNFATLYDGYLQEVINDKSLTNGGLNAAVYTQITDVENECNGLMTYDRLVKPNMDRIFASNLKAITGRVSSASVIPTSESVPQTWQYTTNTPPANWYATNFNASAWSTGSAGFGTADPNVTPNTTWNTPGYIYLRRVFNPGSLTQEQLTNLAFKTYHDEDLAVYINGVQAATASGYSTTYIYLLVNGQGQSAIIPNATNLMAVSCYQSAGGQFIDVGISVEQLIANTYTIPADEIGFWPLDATNGTIAADASGNGNNGAVHGATWSPNGKVSGCLSFNGVNNNVQITNPVSGDFSIVAWVKTTQTGGTGQWYNGAGIVDGDVPTATNDFGTSLIGNKFAFGVGNPDTTILSTSAINDGNWHLCVATRVQSTGLLSIYVDGVLQATGTGGTPALNASASLDFGQIASGGGFFNGSLDQIEIFNRALGGNEVAALYSNGALPQTAPVILQGPVSQTVLAGGTASFAAQAIGGNLAYQWNFAGSPIPGATNNTFIMSNVAVNAAGNYSIVVSNAAGTATNTVSLTVQQPPPTTLLHRYSFVSDATDSVGGANGTLKAPNGGAAASINQGLTLPGNTHGGYGYSGYVALPPGLLTTTTNLTVECWVSQTQGNTWAEIWDFGNNGSQNFGLIPYPANNGNNMEVAFTPSGGELDVQSTISFPSGTQQYICLTYNNATLTGILYTNGVLVASRTFPNSTYTPGAIGGGNGTTNNTLGNDVYGDDQFAGTIYEFRIWNGVVSPLYLLVSAAAGPSIVSTNLTPVSVSVSVLNGSMSGGATQQATATGNFTGASAVTVTSYATNWTTSNTNVLTVNSNGLVTAIEPGTATISATVNGTTGTSSSITVQSTAPSITKEPPQSLTLLTGVTLNVAVANIGSPPFVYRWYFANGTNPVYMSSSSTLIISNLQPINSGAYQCVVSNQYGIDSSTAMNLNVIGATAYEKSLLSLSPIAYWPLSETSGTVARDVVGGNNGTYVGGCTLSQAGPTNLMFDSSSSVLFDGTSGYVDIPEGPFNITGPITTVAWLDIVSLPTFGGIFGHGDTSWRMSVNGSGQPGGSDGNATDATSATGIADGNWHMVAYTYNGFPGSTDAFLYVDGLQVANQSVATAPVGNGLDVWIGGSPDYSTGRLLHAKIAHAAIFNQALSSTQIQELNAGIYASPVTLDIRLSGTNAVLTWPAGTLLQAPTALGPWQTIGAAVSPFSISAGSNVQFFKILVHE